jgi:hypothetical protein
MNLEEIIQFRARSALRCSRLMRHSGYREVAVPILGALAIDDRRRLPPNLSAILLGHTVRHNATLSCTTHLLGLCPECSIQRTARFTTRLQTLPAPALSAPPFLSTATLLCTITQTPS